MVRAGLCALEFYTPETGSWRQVSLVYFLILRVARDKIRLQIMCK